MPPVSTSRSTPCSLLEDGFQHVPQADVVHARRGCEPEPFDVDGAGRHTRGRAGRKCRNSHRQESGDPRRRESQDSAVAAMARGRVVGAQWCVSGVQGSPVGSSRRKRYGDGGEIDFRTSFGSHACPELAGLESHSLFRTSDSPTLLPVRREHDRIGSCGIVTDKRVGHNAG